MELEWAGIGKNWRRFRRVLGSVLIVAAGLVTATASGLAYAVVVAGVRP